MKKAQDTCYSDSDTLVCECLQLSQPTHQMHNAQQYRYFQMLKASVGTPPLSSSELSKKGPPATGHGGGDGGLSFKAERGTERRAYPFALHYMTFGHTLLSGSEKLLLREVFTSVQDSGSLSGYIRTYVFVRFSSPCSHREMYSPEPNSALVHIRFLERKLIMERRFLDKVEDNAAHNPERFTRVERNLGLVERGGQTVVLFPLWGLAVPARYEVDLVPTIEEYMALLRCSNSQVDRIYSRAANAHFLRRLMNITEGRCLRPEHIRLSYLPRALGHIDEAVTDLFDRLDKGVTPVFSENYSPLKEIVATPRRDDISREKWMAILQNLQEENIEWKAPWLLPDEILYRCGLAECEFSYGGDRYKKRIREVSNAWNQTRQMKRLAVGPMTTSEYDEWRVRRVNDNISKSSYEGS
ncbi:hypothetical protein GOBAR_DD13734 [Gossypium barbadense]|nr:hypothetical protein GOBAR_DD13734 [Gossypium barbadense]